MIRSIACGTFFSLLLGGVLVHAEEQRTLHTFKTTQLSKDFFSEGATIADVNKDGVTDVVSGPYWYAGPKFLERAEIYPPKPYDIEGYSDNFLMFAHDVNKDGWDDVIVVGFPGAETFWYANPQGKAGHWPRHLILAVTDNESPMFADVTGDGAPELICMTGGQIGYAEFPQDDPAQPWKFIAASPKKEYQRFTHGIGYGDVNGDGRVDLLEQNGWWERPEQVVEGEPWKFHALKFSEPGGSQMFAYDFDGDGDNDVVTAKAAHAYGLAWFENHGPGENGDVKFTEHKIMGERAEENDYGVAFSQLHALDLVDMDNDGIRDIVTGKRWWAHSQHDPGSLEPAVLYWFKTVRQEGKVRFVPHEIHNNSGVGTGVCVGDVNGDKLPDIVVGNKKGTFVTIHATKNVSQAEWDRAQPNLRQGLTAPTFTGSTSRDSGQLQPTSADASTATVDGIPATSADGRVLNLDFETGDLTDWTAEGHAFKSQPIEGDTVKARRGDAVSGHKGKFWIGPSGGDFDAPQGTLMSVPFTAAHPYASFLVAGGAGNALGVQIVDAETGHILFRASGRASEELRLAVADLRPVLGKQIFLRIVDRASAGWGHVNFDHFRFHDSLPDAGELEPGEQTSDHYPHAGLPGEEAVAVMSLPKGFNATLFAAEPDVMQPIAMAIDDRGRLWIAEAYEYPVRAEGEGRDRILIFEDMDNDGNFDSRKVFADKLNLVSGIEVGFGGVWIGAAPYFMFIPDRNHDDKPDGEPEILLDGWAWQDTHETLNTFIWGPDGWLYGCHGVFTHSRVGKPGTPDDQRVPINAAIWRYHPTRHVFEIFAEGTSNPWGVDFDDYGNAFSTACVIPHLYHIIPGARYQRQAGSHFNPYTYDDIKTIADHRHYLGDNPHGGNGNSGDAGGGHAHAGAMIYLGGTWPEEYRGRIFMNNIHGQRLNTDILKPAGSGFVGSHGPDFLLTGDLASQILNIRYGPDGNAYVIDWYDTNACHHNNIEGHDRSNGRIYKIVYGEPKPLQVNLAHLSDLELAELVLEKNDWYVRHSRRLLQERAAAGKLESGARNYLINSAVNHQDDTRRVRALWALHVTGGLPGEQVAGLLEDESEQVRAWTIRLAVEGHETELAAYVDALAQYAREENSPVVRLAIAAALQRLPVAQRWPVIEALTRHTEDAADHNLPLMYWYAMEPLAEENAKRAVQLGLSCGNTIPILREFMIRRIASMDEPEALAALVAMLGESTDAQEQLEIVAGMREALQGQRRVAPPANWPAAFAAVKTSDNARLRLEAVALGVTFGDASAIEMLRTTAESADAEPSVRQQALDALLRIKAPDLAATLLKLLADPAMREAALGGLALYEDAAVPPAILQAYGDLSAQEKRAAIATLCSRAAYGLHLLNAVAANQIPAADLSADMVRQLRNHKHPEIDRLLVETWGQVRNTPEDKAKLIGELRELMNQPPGVPDLALGRAVFVKTCQQCHTLYGVGAQIGPDLTGSNRADLEYLLSNVVDPSSVIAKDYQQTVVVTADGLVLSGILKAEDDKSVTIQTTTDVVVVPKAEIENRQLSDVSMMPDDQLKQFTSLHIVSLLAYLQAKEQPPILATKENQELLFNGKDLAGWQGDPNLWSVENGEIVGRSPGLERNAFLFSDLAAEDFELTFEIKLLNDEGNTGVQFRSEPFEDGEARGYQADGGPGWWGKLYEESARGLLWDKPGEQHVRKGEWNEYKIRARGRHIQTWINGQPCVDLEDREGATRGQFALQIHSGPPMEVRFRKLKLEVLE